MSKVSAVHQVVKFLVVGSINTAVGYLLYAGMLRAGLSYATASLCALVLGIFLSFQTQGALVFHNRDRRLIVRFAACWAVIYLCNIGLIWALLQIGLNAYFAGALAMLPVVVLSYLTQKYFVFRTGNVRHFSEPRT